MKITLTSLLAFQQLIGFQVGVVLAINKADGDKPQDETIGLVRGTMKKNHLRQDDYDTSPRYLQGNSGTMGNGGGGGGGTGGNGNGNGKKTPSPVQAPTPSVPCGCQACTNTVLSTLANGASCLDRINYKQTVDGLTELNACRFVSDEYPAVCGPDCHPDKCDGQCLEGTFIADPSPTPSPPLARTDAVFCFPSYNNRWRYSNVWGGHTIEGKDSNGGSCGPASNTFTDQNLQFNTNANELTMEYKQVNGVWQASEVRILLGDTASFTYGTFSLHIKSIDIYDGTTLLSTDKLPMDMVFGFFTFDTTVPTNEAPYGLEVDMEIGQFGVESDKDVQFLIQPAGSVRGPHYREDLRFFSGGSPLTYNQGGHTYSITWNPGSIFWSTTAAGGRTQEYTSAFVYSKCTNDFIQCLPNNLEVRLNLWHLGGRDATPTFEQTSSDYSSYRVVAVIDDFSFTPSGQTHLANGEICSKDCQCASSAACIDAMCTAVL